MRTSHPWRWIVAAGLVLAGASPALARDWAAANVRGTVLTIAEGRWAEFDRDALVSADMAIRTLQSGRLTLSSRGETIAIGPNTALELFTRPDRDTTLIRHYAGTLTLAGEAAAGLRVEARNLVVTPASGTLVIRVEGERAEVRIDAGKATVLDNATGRRFTVAGGDVLAGSGGAITVATAGGNHAGGNGGNGNGPGSNSAGGNGNGNGNGPGGNSAGGDSNNGNGPGSSNAGGNGNNGNGPGENSAGGNNNGNGNVPGGNGAGGNNNGGGNGGGNGTGNGSGGNSAGGNGNGSNAGGGNNAGGSGDPAPAP